jgi:nucleoid DNA-binding protein
LSSRVPTKGLVLGWNRTIRRIAEDGKKAGIDLTPKIVERVIRLFFSRIVSAMHRGLFINIDEFGSLGMTPKERLSRWAKEQKIMVARFIHKKLRTRRRWHRLRFERQWKAVMEIRKSKGLPLWSYKQWMKVTGHKL